MYTLTSASKETPCVQEESSGLIIEAVAFSGNGCGVVQDVPIVRARAFVSTSLLSLSASHQSSMVRY